MNPITNRGDEAGATKDNPRQSLEYNEEQEVIANEEGCDLYQQLDWMESELQGLKKRHALLKKDLEIRNKDLEIQKKDLEIQKAQIALLKNKNQEIQLIQNLIDRHHLDRRQEAIRIWMRDAWQEATPERIKKEVVYDGNISTDAVVVTTRFAADSPARTQFSNLYGLDPDTAIALSSPNKCPKSLWVLDSMASFLLTKARKELPDDKKKNRDTLVAFLKAQNFEEAERFAGLIEHDECGCRAFIRE
ncbi:hypothetical protein P170DRAFT_473694 [Aspergillus steynii IBT 23096]|uniref:Uncharacterized protein n=1 Tax=Aspergillus steynii IBT 23096 TaxID=1392250 RepID=A0A2I2GB64_9EURO|nr:uncharacterized protein P170DRAFT_473694 [Aspergillus steynii IBT 23096]PLB50119.1 hypothetical protein P170DRAFT_473694 [Aspergillus steynii IBT 23096]